jgi:hypothetical protein
VRAGDPRAEVAQALDIPLSTLAGWAHRGKWRRKDLVTVRDAKRGARALELIEELNAADRLTKQKEAARMHDALESSKAELETIAPGGHLPGALGEGPIPARKLAMAMADSLLRQGRLEEADRALRLSVRFAEAEQSSNAREETKVREERERLTAWWAEKQTAYHKLHQAAQFALDEIVARIELEASRSAEECCPRCDRPMHFWPEEVDGPDEDDDSGAGDSGGGRDDDSSRRRDDDDSSKRAGDDDFAKDDSVRDDSGGGDSGSRTGSSGGSGVSHWKQDTDGDWYWDGPPE